MKAKLNDLCRDARSKSDLAGLDRLVSDILNRPVTIIDHYKKYVYDEVFIRVKERLRGPRRLKYFFDRYFSPSGLVSYQKIADSFGVSRAAVSQSIFYSLSILRESFESNEWISFTSESKSLMIASNGKLNYRLAAKIADSILKEHQVISCTKFEAADILKSSSELTSLEGMKFTDEELSLILEDYKFRDHKVEIADNRRISKIYDYRTYNYSLIRSAGMYQFQTIESSKLSGLCKIEDLIEDIEFHSFDRSLKVANSILMQKLITGFGLGFENVYRRVEDLEFKEFILNLDPEIDHIVTKRKLERSSIKCDELNRTGKILLTTLTDDQIDFFDKILSAEIRINGYTCRDELFVSESSLKFYEIFSNSKIVTRFYDSFERSFLERIIDRYECYETLVYSSNERDFRIRLNQIGIFENSLIEYVYRIKSLGKELDIDDFYLILNEDDLIQLYDELSRFCAFEDLDLEGLKEKHAAF